MVNSTSGMPGPRTPGEEEVDTQQVEVTGIDPSGTGATEVGKVFGRDQTVSAVHVDGDVADYDFNVEADGNTVFSSDQSPSAASPETFTPDDSNKRQAGSDAVTYDFDVTSAGSAGTVDVVLEVELRQ